MKKTKLHKPIRERTAYATYANQEPNFLQKLCQEDYIFPARFFKKIRFLFLATIIIWAFTVFNLYMLHKSTSLDSANELDTNLMKSNVLPLSMKMKNSGLPNSSEWVSISTLLENIWKKLEVNELKLSKLEAMIATKEEVALMTTTTSTPPLPEDQKECDVTDEELVNYGACKNKIQWMLKLWKTDSCYADYGVDGSLCSIRYYLSEIENWCPVLPEGIAFTKPKQKNVEKKIIKALWNRNLSQLISLMDGSSSRVNYLWIMDRIARLWHLWVEAADSFQNDEQFQIDNKFRSQRKILIYLGFLSKKSGFRIQQSATAGGPLGELVQWSDILSALFVMDHKLIITSEYEELVGMLDKLPTMKSQCQARKELPYDMIITDITGLTHFKKYVKQGYGKFSCLLRIIDTFGTEAAYNNLAYSRVNRKFKTAWGGQELDLRQFYTMFPHSPDNSFMGFVVEQHLNSTESQSIERKQRAVVYGKSLYMWSGKQDYLTIINKYLEVHGTVFLQDNETNMLPKFVVNHGILSGPDLQRLLSESKLFIGLGFPYEGPAPLEAIAAGCVFINPKFDPPHSSLNTKFFKGKPTARELTSQHPYAEDYISYPNVFTVDISNLNEVDRVIREALELIENNTVKPYLPFEYTHKGMLQRLNTYMEHQDFCPPPPKDVWPPKKAVTVVLSELGRSCKEECKSRDMICEPSHFRLINKKETFETIFTNDPPSTNLSSINNIINTPQQQQQQAHPLLGKKCSTSENKADLYNPSIHGTSLQCKLQSDNLLFSCVDKDPNHFRICPCRQFIRGQIALCPGCL